MNVEKFCEELWGGVKVSSNWEISRSPRNSFWASLTNYPAGVELLDGDGELPACPLQPNSEYCGFYRGSQSVGDNVHAQKGKNPNRQLRPPSWAECIRKSVFRDSQDVGLEAATI